MYEKLNEPISVLALFEDGRLRPLRFRWHNQVYRILKVTGHWIVHEGEHRHHYYAALCEGANLFEMSYDSRHTTWQLRSVYIDG